MPSNSFYCLIMLENKKQKYDEALVHQLNKIDDWWVYGSLGMRVPTAENRIKDIFYKIIRPFEVGNKGEFIFRIEGDNIQRERHFHFLLTKSTWKTKSINFLKNSIRRKIAELKLVTNIRGEKTYPELASCSPHLEPYDPSLGAKWYVAKIATDEKERLQGRSLTSCVDGMDWKLSSRLFHRMKSLPA